MSWSWSFEEMGLEEHLMVTTTPDHNIDRIPVVWHEVIEPSDDLLLRGPSGGSI